jgi:hypothetical protein
MRLFHFLKKEYALQALAKRRVKVARIGEMNDRFELLCMDMPNPEERRRFAQFRRKVDERFGFVCLTRAWRNPLMWSLYAGNHTGAALEIEIDDDAAMPVKYSKSRIQWDVQEIMRSGGFTQEHVDVLATTKSHHWNHEEEVRVAVQLTDCEQEDGRFFVSVDIKGVVIGSFSDLSLAEIRSVLPKDRELTVAHARLAFRTFDVVQQQREPVVSVKGMA